MDDKEKVLRDTLAMVIEDEGIKDPKIEIKPISTGGANYSSVLFLISISDSDNKNLELFAKVICIGEQIRKQTESIDIMDLEPNFYREICKIYNKLQEDKNIPNEEKYLFPKFYAYNDEYSSETLILENLAAKGFVLYDRFESVTWEYASAAVGELAKFHALSYAFLENHPEKFDEVVGGLHNFHSMTDMMFHMWKKSEDTALNALPEESRDRLREFFDKESTYEKYKKFYSSSRRPVLVHGDYRPSNLMHKITEGKLDQLIPLDYQTIHCGCPVNDLLYFIFLSSDGEFRRLHYKQLIEHYYTTFAYFLTKLGLSPSKVYSREDFDEDLKENLPFGLLISAVLLPIILVDTENAPTLAGDAEITDILVKSNDMFEKRFREIFNDYVEWGIV